MSIENVKLELIQEILEIDNQEVLIKMLGILEEFQQSQTPDLSEAQISEIDRRLELLESGKTKLYDADEFFQELRNELFEKCEAKKSEEKAENYDELLLQLLRRRSEETKQNPELVLTSEESRKNIIEKFNWHGKI